MIKLTTRQKQVALDLLNQTYPITVKSLASKYLVSTRTIRYDLDMVEHWLASKNAILVKKPGVGIWVEISDGVRNGAIKELKNVSSVVTIPSQRKRIRLILFELLRNVQPLTGEELSSIIGVSKTTIVKDLKVVRRELAKHGMSLYGKPRVGYGVEGDEGHIRNLISSFILDSMELPDLLDMLSRINQEEDTERHLTYLVSGLEETSPEIKLQDVKRAIKAGKAISDFWMPDSSFASLLVHLAIAVDRIKKGRKIGAIHRKIDILKEHPEYKIAEAIAGKLSEMFDVSIPTAEIANIAVHLISADLKLKVLHDEMHHNDSFEIGETVEDMISIFKTMFPVSQGHLDQLKNDLVSHLQLTIKKLALGIVPNNPMLDQIKTRYGELFNIAEKMASIFAAKQKIHLPESEVGYIALHLGAYTETLHHNKTKKTALIICTTGRGSAKILATRIRNRLPELDVLATVSAIELNDKQYLVEEADIVISTVQMPSIGKPIITVSPFITNNEISKLKDYLYDRNTVDVNDDSSREAYLLDSILNVTEKYTAQKDREKLKSELFHLVEFMTEQFRVENKKQGIRENFAYETAMILVEFADMFEELNSHLSKKELMNLLGVIIHILMALPRWQTGQLIGSAKAECNEQEHSDAHRIVKKHLDRIAKKHHLKIAENEAIAIARYFV